MNISPLRAARLLRGLSLDTVAVACGIDHSVLSRLERGLLPPTLRTRELEKRVTIFLGLEPPAQPK